MDSANLKCTTGGSNKFYQCGIEPRGDGFVVAYAHGPIGGTPQTGIHKDTRAVPVPYAKAKKVFDKLVASKLAKEYVYAGGNGMVIVGTGDGKAQSGIKPQLLNPIDEEHLEDLFRDNDYMMEEKKDGQRRLVKRSGDEVFGINRKGQIVALPELVVNEMKKLPDQIVLDGEQIAATLWAFDTLRAEEDITKLTAEERYFITIGLVAVTGAPVQAIKAAFSEADKRAMFAYIEANRGEGVVFKLRSAVYTPGKPSSGGPQLKFKFWSSCTCMVHKVHSFKLSVSLMISTGAEAYQNVGNVTIPANYPIPAEDSLVEVKYLYAYKGGSLYQPQYLGERDDVEIDALDSLKFKPVDSDEDDGKIKLSAFCQYYWTDDLL